MKYGDVGVVGVDGKALTDEEVCRPACADCKDDLEEVCPGGQDACPIDLIFQTKLDLIAGQHNDAGSTTITVTDVSTESEVKVVK